MPWRWALVAMVVARGTFPSPVDAAEVDRLAWVGLQRGPWSPSQARALEVLLIDELDGYDSFRLVDAGGQPLDDRLLASSAALMSRLVDQGIDAFLNFEHAAAIKKLEQAIALFETELLSLRDHALLHEALLAKSEAEFQAGHRAAALATLKQLAAYSPKKRPEPGMQVPELVKLWKRAELELGTAGRIRVEAEGEDCVIQLDGQVLGPAPVEAPHVRPGRHYVVARWPHARVPTIVRVTEGKETKLNIELSGSAKEARDSILSAITDRVGADEMPGRATRVAALARAGGALVAALRKTADESTWLVVGKHDEVGALEKVVGTPLASAPESEETSQAVRRLAMAMFVDQRPGELSLLPDGSAQTTPGMNALLYGGRLPAEPTASNAADPNARAPLGSSPEDEFFRAQQAKATPPPAEDSITDTWWFWTALGVVAVGAAVTTGVLLAGRDPTTTTFEVTLP